MKPMSTCLWFDGQAEEAARFYLSVFENGKIGRISYYPDEGQEIHRQKAGTVMTVEFEVNGQKFLGLNGGPEFKFDEAISFVISCDSQDEIDNYWNKLTQNGGKESLCGWLKDRFGVSWQIVPTVLADMMADPDKEKSGRVMKAFMQMKKFDIKALKAAYNS
ncbi:MAG TPA: VOC family protein [Bacteriovoracaceae bacterium]|nr:VOC family protein [Bacteriovoracaceae bacterium]